MEMSKGIIHWCSVWSTVWGTPWTLANLQFPHTVVWIIYILSWRWMHCSWTLHFRIYYLHGEIKLPSINKYNGAVLMCRLYVIFVIFWIVGTSWNHCTSVTLLYNHNLYIPKWDFRFLIELHVLPVMICDYFYTTKWITFLCYIGVSVFINKIHILKI